MSIYKIHKSRKTAKEEKSPLDFQWNAETAGKSENMVSFLRIGHESV
jgi:hypothetical protein